MNWQRTVSYTHLDVYKRQDYRLARLLAAEVITEEPFEEIREETLQKAFETIGKCKRVINAGAVSYTHLDVYKRQELIQEK